MYNTKDLINIASYDSGLELEAKNHTVADLTDIASYAARKVARIVIILKNCKLSTSDLINIASYGKGCVSFKDL